ncbi:MAG: dihydroorotase [Proteobacteria bacterium]|nr:dihydroorotase [Pseudomonadota bacterium]
MDSLGGVIVADGVIADIGPQLARAAALGARGIEAVDCQCACLAPGLVDMRVQLREPGEEHKETMASAGAAAAAGGITTMICLPNTRPVLDDAALVESVMRRARETACVHIRPYAAVTKGLAGREMTEMGLLAEAGAVGFTDATHAVADSVVMRRALAYSKAFNRPIIQHPEEPSLAQGGVMNEGEIAMRLGLTGIPIVAEVIMVERDLRLVELTGGRCHIAHLSTAAAVDAVRRAKARGINVTADTAPQYFALNELAVGDYRTFAKVSPPLRSEEDRQAVVDGLKDGTIDAIASDHAPHDQDSKRLPFAQAAFGMIGLETLLAVTLELVHNRRLSLMQAVAKLTSGPAAILGLPAGTLAKNAAADLVLFDPERPWRIAEKKFRSKSKNSPFDGRPVQGRALKTLVDGAVVFTLEE